MNTGSPKLLVIPSSNASGDNSDSRDHQDREPLYHHKQQSLKERLRLLVVLLLRVANQVSNWFMTLVELVRHLKRRIRRVEPVRDDSEEELEGSQYTVEMESSTATANDGNNDRVLTPVTRCRSAGPQHQAGVDEITSL